MSKKKELKKAAKETLTLENILKAAAASFPGTASAASLYADWKNNTEIRNIKDLIETHGKKLQDIESKINKEYMNSEEYIYTLHRTILKVRNELRENKKKLFADFLSKSCLTKNSSNNDKLLYLEVLDKMELEHIKLLEVLNNYKNQFKEGFAIDDEIAKLSNLPEERVRFLVQYFLSLGLVCLFYDFEIQQENGHMIQEDRYYVSDFGYGLLEYLKED